MMVVVAKLFSATIFSSICCKISTSIGSVTQLESRDISIKAIINAIPSYAYFPKLLSIVTIKFYF